MFQRTAAVATVIKRNRPSQVNASRDSDYEEEEAGAGVGGYNPDALGLGEDESPVRLKTPLPKEVESKNTDDEVRQLRARLADLPSVEEAYVAEKVLKQWRDDHRDRARLLAAQDAVAGEASNSPRSKLHVNKLGEWYRNEKGMKQLQRVKESLEKKEELKVNYLNLFGFIIFTALFMAILVMQKNPTIAFQVENSLIESTFTIPSGLVDPNAELYYDVGTPAEIYTWMNKTILGSVFVDSSCGNGKCEAPDEYKGFGRFGCQSDCGFYPQLSAVTIELQPDGAYYESSWNVFSFTMGDDIYSTYQGFEHSSLHTTTINVPDGKYELNLRDTAGDGGVSGRIIINGTTVAEWPSYYFEQEYNHCDMRQWPTEWFTGVIEQCIPACYSNTSETNMSVPCDNLGHCNPRCRAALANLKARASTCLNEGFIHHEHEGLGYVFTATAYLRQLGEIFSGCLDTPFGSTECSDNSYCSNGDSITAPLLDDDMMFVEGGGEGGITSNLGAKTEDSWGTSEDDTCNMACFSLACGFGGDACSGYRTLEWGETGLAVYLVKQDGTYRDGLSYADITHFIRQVSTPEFTPENTCNSEFGFGEVIDVYQKTSPTGVNYPYREHANWGDCTPYTSEFGLVVSVFAYNPTGTVLDIRDNSGSKERYVGEKNRLLGGIFINQKRAVQKNCTSRYTSAMTSTCINDYVLDAAPYSVDPVFITTSSLHDAFVRKDNFYSPRELASTLLPYAFFHSYAMDDGTVYTGINDYNTTGTLSDAESPFGSTPTLHSINNDFSGYHAIFDNDLSELQSKDYLQFLQDGFFLDELTKELSIRYCTYNFEYGLLTMMTVKWTFEKGGRIRYRHIIQSMPMEPYLTTWDTVRLGMEIAFCLLLVYTLIMELMDCTKAKKKKGNVMAYFADIGNIFDLASIGCMFAIVMMWVYIVMKGRTLLLSSDFNVYRYQGTKARVETAYARTSRTPARFFEYDGGNHASYIAFMQEVSNLAFFNEMYTVICGINILLLVFRLLKLMHFQARMGLLTRTLSHASTDLLHFVILFMITFTGFAFMAYLLFGHQLREFMNLGESMLTCFEMIVGNYEIGRQLDYVGSTPVSGVVFYWAYFFIVFLILINILLAILVDSFADVKNHAQESSTMIGEIVEICQFYKKGNAKKYVRDGKILKVIKARLDELEGKQDEVESGGSGNRKGSGSAGKVHPYNGGKGEDGVNMVDNDEDKNRAAKERTVDADLLKEYLRPTASSFAQHDIEEDKHGKHGRHLRELDDDMLDSIAANVLARHNVSVEEKEQVTVKEVLRLLEIEDLFRSRRATAAGRSETPRKEASLNTYGRQQQHGGGTSTSNDAQTSLLTYRIEGLERELASLRTTVNDMKHTVSSSLQNIQASLREMKEERAERGHAGTQNQQQFQAVAQQAVRRLR
eukprot:CAMPEP_0113904696 /NCGR_PEP_ID=MMETSP0780_2-20120614/23454_1 /TAXON_ID=652834 /ORGANISM="Palpitomonas bilix" /LENGTH=1416 /DNA_ID=CAMNT_0000898451 /DNA_START=419 /DNA_END=4669 /DNA_ORIENTATION=- /assembly_acc=CAM_ASM_000599